jgi:hypothetical protein
MQVTTVSIFHFSGWKNKYWAFSQMGIGPFRLKKVAGMQFIKLLGSGAINGFSILPDFSTYAILAVWEKETFAQQFFSTHPLFIDYQNHSDRAKTHFLHNTMSHGQWNSKNPFTAVQPFDPNAPVAVLTRATIRKRRLWAFWSQVPSASVAVEKTPGLQFAIGIGEAPLIHQATFSIWESGKQMMAYAYSANPHKGIIKETRTQNWYKEELFARFIPYKTIELANNR